MADHKMANTGGVARRSARVFESDIDVIRQPEAKGAESGSYLSRRRGELEQLADKNEKISRRSSISSSKALSDDALSSYTVLTRENSRDALTECQPEPAKKSAKPKTPGRPRNFGLVAKGIYRSGYPEAEDHAFLKELGLKTIVTLVDKEFPEGYQTFMQSTGINHVLVKMEGTKKVDIPEHTMKTILDVVLDERNHPLLVHCNQGRHRTGCAVAAIRNLMGWPVDHILEEYTTYAEPKVREVDVKWINRFQTDGSVRINVGASYVLDGPKPRNVYDTQKMAKMVLVAMLLIIIGTLVYLHGSSLYVLT